MIVVMETSTHKHVVLPTRELRDLYIRAVRQRRVKWNYANCYLDTQGYGLQLALADWCTEQGITYVSR